MVTKLTRTLSHHVVRLICRNLQRSYFHSTTFAMTTAPPAPPAPTESSKYITFQSERYLPIREGAAQILTTALKKGEKESQKVQKVFYNPVQQYNRDLSVLAIRAFAEDYVYVRQNRKRQGAKSKDQGAQPSKSSHVHTENAGPGEGRHATAGMKRTVQGSHEDEPPVTTEQPTTESVWSRDEDHGADKQLNGDTNQALKRKRQDSPEKSSSAAEQPASKRRESQEEGEKIRLQISSLDSASDSLPAQNGAAKEGASPAARRLPFRILDALSATGLRALRYAKEVPQATQITANDLTTAATAAIKRNVDYNGVVEMIQISTADAVNHMHHASQHHSQRNDQLYQVIDLDPYGTAAPFLDSAVRALSDGGLLCVTCTDAGVFASTAYLEKAFSQYGGSSIDGPHSHEGGIRLIIQSIATTAAKYGLAVEPVLSLSIDFYIRLFIRVHRSPAQVKFLASKSMLVHSCDHGCGAWSLQFMGELREKKNRSGETLFHHKAAQGPSASPHCEHCQSRMHIAGPMWGGPLHNPRFIEHILSSLPPLDKETYQTLDRLEGMLSIALSECELHDLQSTQPVTATAASSVAPDSNGQITHSSRPIPPLPPHLRHTHPFFLHLPSLSKVLHTATPSEAQFRGALMGLGHRVVRSHAKPGSLATDASWNVIWRVMREWVKQKSPIKEGSLKEGTPGLNIINGSDGKPGSSGGPEMESLKGKIQELLSLTGEEAVQEGLRALLTDMGEIEGSKDKGEIVFDEKIGKRGLLKEKGTIFYAQHPPGWGPMKKAGGT